MALHLRWLVAFCLLSPPAVFATTDAKVTFEKQKIELQHGKNKKTILVEVARSPAQHERGLMGRQKLGADEGMLFIFNEERTLEFWMKNTLIDLDIGYFNQKRTLVDVQQMNAPSLMQKELPSYPSRKPARYALEMNAGWFKKNRFSSGTTLRFLSRP